MPSDKENHLKEALENLVESSDWPGVRRLVDRYDSDIKDSPELSWLVGWSMFKAEDLILAISYLEKAARLSPDSPVAHWALGCAFREHGDFAQAINSLEKSLDLKDSSLARISLCIALRESGRQDEAENIYREGMVTHKNDPRMFESYGDYLSDCGRPDEAIRFYAEAKRLAKMAKGS